MLEDYLKDDQEPAVEPAPAAKDPEEELEASIFTLAVAKEQHDDPISADLEHKLAALLEKAQSTGDPEEAVRLRMNELALSKVLMAPQILVHTHSKSDFRLVLAHFHLGKAYARHQCSEQAIDHITLALKKNSKLGEVKEAKLFHSYLLTRLAACYLDTASFQEALEILTRAEEIQQSCDPLALVPLTQALKAKCLAKLKHFGDAAQALDKALQATEARFGGKSLETAELHAQKAELLFEQQKVDAAVAEIQNALGGPADADFHSERGEDWPARLVELLHRKAGYLETRPAQQIEVLRELVSVLRGELEEPHRDILKVKRRIASQLLKCERSKEAAEQLEEILESEARLYGGSSVSTGKTLKMLGVAYSKDEKLLAEAESCLQRAVRVFQEQGEARLAKESKAKLEEVRATRRKKAAEE